MRSARMHALTRLSCVHTGTGALTRHLLAAGALVTAVEKDEALAARLEREYASVSALVEGAGWEAGSIEVCGAGEGRKGSGATHPTPPNTHPQEPRLRVVTGDILRQHMPDLLHGMEAWAAQHAAAAQQQGAEGTGAAHGSGEPAAPQGQQQGAASAAEDAEQQQGQTQQQQQQQKPSPPPCPGRSVKVVANLPYYITKDCLLQVGGREGGGGGVEGVMGRRWGCVWGGRAHALAAGGNGNGGGLCIAHD